MMVNEFDRNSRLVYSTDKGRIKEEEKKNKINGDGVVRVTSEKKGRGGKVVTVISGLLLGGSDLKEFARQLKKLCDVGGSVKNNNIELQGDHIDKIVDELAKKGYNAKRSGG